MLGIIIGVAAVITMVAVGAGAHRLVEEQIKSLGSNLIVVFSGTTTTGGARTGAGSRPSITEDDANAIAREIPSVEVSSATVRGGAQAVVGNQNWGTSIQGVTIDYLAAREWGLSSGRVFTGEDLSSAGKVAIVGQTIVDQLFNGGDPIGQAMRIRSTPVTIIGVLDRKGQTTQGQDQDDIVLVPLSTAKKRIFGWAGTRARSVGGVLVKVRDGYDMKETEAEVKELLRQRHRLAARDDDDFTIRNLTEIAATREESSRILAFLLAAVASVSLIVGGIGIMNIMLVSVTERTREIGLRMAVGARRSDILVQFLIEAVTLAIIGGVIGILLGAGSSLAIASFAGWPTLIEIDAVLLAFFFSSAVGVFFGFYPARKASRLDPIEALRYE
ncbi:MAG: FtsX-like permease family protein [Alphaproteobacteria bacterium]|nr:FtsX-like permease family protein [Alphaproteobacteria bacterium]